MKKAMIAALMAAVSMTSLAQSGTNSPYSQYGLGLLSDQTSSFNRGMSGLGYAFHEHDQVNYLNPASYSTVDSLTFLFDAGISLQLTNFEEGGKKKNAKNADLEYVVASFRAAKNLGVSFGLVPYTVVGYDYSNTERVSEIASTESEDVKFTNTYSGSGGLHQVYLGAGWAPLKGLSVGVNASYLWGDYTRSVVNSYSDNSVNTLSKYYTAEVKNYKLDFGVQYTTLITKKDELTVGLTYGFGHKLNADPECMVVSTNSSAGVADTTTYVVDNGLSIPHVFGAGVAWTHAGQWRVGADYQLQKWGSIDFPQYTVVNSVPTYQLASGLFSDRHKITLGGEYCQNERSRRFLGRIHYRAGVSYATPYLKINGQDGPKELVVSAGFGIPIINTYNNRSMLNISAHWVNQSAGSLIKENTFRINVGFTFNERWFAKFKVE